MWPSRTRQSVIRNLIHSSLNYFWRIRYSPAAHTRMQNSWEALVHVTATCTIASINIFPKKTLINSAEMYRMSWPATDPSSTPNGLTSRASPVFFLSRFYWIFATIAHVGQLEGKPVNPSTDTPFKDVGRSPHILLRSADDGNCFVTRKHGCTVNQQRDVQAAATRTSPSKAIRPSFALSAFAKKLFYCQSSSKTQFVFFSGSNFFFEVFGL